MFDEFCDASYAKRYETLLTKIVRLRLYNAASLILSPSDAGQKAEYDMETIQELLGQKDVTTTVMAFGGMERKLPWEQLRLHCPDYQPGESFQESESLPASKCHGPWPRGEKIYNANCMRLLP